MEELLRNSRTTERLAIRGHLRALCRLARKRRCALTAFLLLATINVVAQAPSAGNTNSFANIIPLPAAPTGPASLLADGHVDLSGVWRPTDNAFIYDLSLGLPKGETLPLTPEALKIKAARLAKDDPEANCLPTGVPRLSPFPWRIVQTPTHIFFLFEGNIHSYRQIFMDGRPHPPHPDPTWYGHSTGRWEKDTLIIDTGGFNVLVRLRRPSAHRAPPHDRTLHAAQPRHAHRRSHPRRPRRLHAPVYCKIHEPSPTQGRVTRVCVPGERKRHAPPARTGNTALALGELLARLTVFNARLYV